MGLLAVGSLLVGQAFVNLAPEGPDSASFTRGTIGLLGMVLIYLAWFKHLRHLRCGAHGQSLVCSETTWLKVVVFGLAWCWRRVRRSLGDDLFPEPTGLLLALIGVLAIMNGVYVWAITNGPLSDEEE